MGRFIIHPGIKFYEGAKPHLFWRVVNWVIPDALFNLLPGADVDIDAILAKEFTAVKRVGEELRQRALLREAERKLLPSLEEVFSQLERDIWRGIQANWDAANTGVAFGPARMRQ